MSFTSSRKPLRRLPLTSNTENRCRYRTRTGRRCRNLRHAALNVCNRHLSHDQKFVTEDLRSSIRQLKAGAPFMRLHRKLSSLVATQRMDPDLANTLTYAAQVMASCGPIIRPKTAVRPSRGESRVTNAKLRRRTQ